VLRPAAADRLRITVLQTPAVLAGNALGVLLVGAIFWQQAGAERVLPWVTAAAVLWGLRLVHWLRLRTLPVQDSAAGWRWRATWHVLVVAMGAQWGVGVWLFWEVGEPHQRLMLLLIVYSYALGAVQLLGMHPRVFLGFLAVVLLPTIARVASDDGQPWHWQLAAILTLLFGITWMMGRRHGSALSRALWLKSRTDVLAEQLRQEMAQAQSARREAEAANRAKTQFLAAASHDLRQPLHAMGLFAEALRHRAHDAEVVDLVSSIHASVDALEGLFGEIMDLSRLEAGAVELRPAPLRLEELYARLRLNFEPAAFDKGLTLGFRGGRLAVQADALALERMLRNLVANAVRYTEAGGVLVSARARGGQVLLQVWDTGIGVPADALPHLFEEFYQAHPGRVVGPGERRGMGLGLSIVARLAVLSGTRVQVRSRPGRGSVFGVTLPRAQAGAPLAFASASPRPAIPTLQGFHVLVIDDDGAVRDGLTTLLRTWGARVTAFGDEASLAHWLEAAGAADPDSDPHPGSGQAASTPSRPDVVIVDHRLVAPGDGLRALQRVRRAWPHRVLPAVLVTGSLLDGPQGHAELAGVPALQVLRKPVPPLRLRALLAAWLGPVGAQVGGQPSGQPGGKPAG
jgi:signal transduction histidine kinase